jgi:predicted N-formylglutamate amidohydrolase
MSKPFHIIGIPAQDGLLIIADHASNHVPSSIVLGLSVDQLQEHIAWDIGVAEVAKNLCEQFGFAGFLGGVSRLVVDCNRERDNPSVIPQSSDGTAIAGNILDSAQREARLRIYYDPYHAALSQYLLDFRPKLILSLHSFTPNLRSDSLQKRPWDIGVLYNNYETASHLMIAELEAHGLHVGDQQPYSGKLLNATMNTHAEANDIPYVGIEMRQDLVSDNEGIHRFAQILGQCSNKIAKKNLQGHKVRQ